MGLNQALLQIERYGGKVDGEELTIATQTPVPVRFEKSFEGIYPIKKFSVNKDVKNVGEITFEGVGIVFKGSVQSKNAYYVAVVEMYIDGKLIEKGTYQHLAACVE